MSDIKKLIPKNKVDVDAVKQLSQYELKEIRPIVPDLLEWLQDANWPVAKYITDYFSGKAGLVANEILAAFQQNDEIWTYWLVQLLLGKEVLNEHGGLRKAVTRFAYQPTIPEVLEEVDLAAQECLEDTFFRESPRGISFNLTFHTPLPKRGLQGLLEKLTEGLQTRQLHFVPESVSVGTLSGEISFLDNSLVFTRNKARALELLQRLSTDKQSLTSKYV